MCKKSKQLNKSKAKRIQLPINENQSNHHTDTYIYYEDIQASTPSGHFTLTKILRKSYEFVTH